jgi:hypothetical protein
MPLRRRSASRTRAFSVGQIASDFPPPGTTDGSIPISPKPVRSCRGGACNCRLLAALRDFHPAYDRNGSLASDQSRQQLRPMSALPPIATKLVRRNEVTLCARTGCEQLQQSRQFIRSPRRHGQVFRCVRAQAESRCWRKRHPMEMQARQNRLALAG